MELFEPTPYGDPVTIGERTYRWFRLWSWDDEGPGYVLTESWGALGDAIATVRYEDKGLGPRWRLTMFIEDPEVVFQWATLYGGFPAPEGPSASLDATLAQVPGCYGMRRAKWLALPLWVRKLRTR